MFDLILWKQLITLLILISWMLKCFSAMSDENACQALVPYTVQQSFLAEFRELSKRVTVSDSLTVTIKQNWNDNGVAGVVWDSVSIA